MSFFVKPCLFYNIDIILFLRFVYFKIPFGLDLSDFFIISIYLTLDSPTCLVPNATFFVYSCFFIMFVQMFPSVALYIQFSLCHSHSLPLSLSLCLSLSQPLSLCLSLSASLSLTDICSGCDLTYLSLPNHLGSLWNFNWSF